MRALAVVVAAALVAAVPAAPADAGRSGHRTVIVGQVTVPPASAAAWFRAGVRISELTGDGRVMSVPLFSTGAFKIGVSPGTYAVVSSGYAETRADVAAGVVVVRRGAKVRFDARPTPAPPTRVSIGAVGVPAGLELYGSGLSDLAVGDLVGRLACWDEVGVYEDREVGRFADVVADLRRQRTARDPRTRRAARQSLATVRRTTPTHRITGQITGAGPTTVSGTWSITDLRTGQVTAGVGLADVAPLAFSSQGMRALAAQLCGTSIESVPARTGGP